MRGRRAAWLSAGAAALVCGGGAFALLGRIQEEWLILQLESKDRVAVENAIEKLGELRSVRAVPRLVEVYREHEAELLDPKAKLVKEVVKTALKIGPQALAPILEPMVGAARNQMVRLLCEDAESTLPVLLACVKDDRSNVMSIAAQCLRKIVNQETEPKLLVALNDPSERVRFAAGWALAPNHARLKAVRELMTASLKDSRPSIRIEAAAMLRLRHPATSLIELARHSAPALIEALQDSERDVRKSAAIMLGASEFEEAIPALVEALDDPDGEIRDNARGALVNISTGIAESPLRRAAVPRLLEKFRGSDSRATQAAAEVLTSFGRDARTAWPVLLEYWKWRPRNEHELFLTARQMGPGAALFIPELHDSQNLKSDRDPSLAIQTVEAMGPKGSSAAASLLELFKAPGDSPYQIKALRLVETALPAICPDGDPVLPELLRIVADSQKTPRDVRCSAAVTVGGFRRRVAIVLPALQAVLEDERASIDLRFAAAEGLGRLGRAARGAAPAIEALARLPGVNGSILVESLRNVDPRNAPRDIVDDIGPRTGDAVSILVGDLRAGRFVESGRLAAQALFRIGKPAVPALAAALRSDDVAVRSQAAEILGWIGPAAEEALPELISALEDEDAEVRRDAAKALPKVCALRDLHSPPKLSPAEAPKLSQLLLDAGGSAITTSEGWAKRRAELRTAWLAFLGGLPQERGPLDLEVLETEEPTKYTRRLVRYRIEDGVTTEAYLLTPWDLPEDGSRKAPAVVVFHSTIDSHSGEPAGLDSYRAELAIGVHLAERGFVAFCPRCFIFDDGADYAGNVARMQARHPERKGMARMLLDAVRAADLLESLPYVDRGGLGCIGHSLGAKEALYASAFDERYRAAVFHEGGVGLAMSNWDAVWYLGPQIREPGFPREHHELLALAAPRAFLLIAGGEADDARSGAFVESGLAVYRLLGADSRLGWVLHSGGHNYTRFARAVAEEFLERSLR